jgi:hypothetical protein
MNMNTAEFLKELRATAEVLKPLTQTTSPNALSWDGGRYSKGTVKTADTGALVWWAILSTIAELVEAQEIPLSAKQIEYLRQLMFGGMGTLNDLSVSARDINKLLDERRDKLFVSFKSLSA